MQFFTINFEKKFDPAFFHFLVKKDAMFFEPEADLASAFAFAELGVDNFCTFDFGSRSSE